MNLDITKYCKANHHMLSEIKNEVERKKAAALQEKKTCAMTRDEARKLIHPKLLSDDLIVLGDGDKITIVVDDKLIDKLADVEFPKKKDQSTD